MILFNLITSATSLTQNIVTSERIEHIIEGLLQSGFSLGKRLLFAIVIFFAGRLIINTINKVLVKILENRNIEPSIRTFLYSLINIALTILLMISIVGALGIDTASFAALLASAGVAIGMALSGNLQNFAGGLVILLFKPYKVSDVVEINSETGIVKEIQIFHTILHTFDNKTVFIPNGSISNGVVTNYTQQKTRRIDFIFGVEYGADFDQVREVLLDVINKDKRILQTPAPQVVLTELASSSVNVLVRVWVKTEEYWNVNFDMNQTVYKRFNAEGIGFPFPQLTVHKA